MRNKKQTLDMLWGATGFTGRRAAMYLHKMYGSIGKVKWTIAGRSRERLEKIRKKIGATDIDILICPGSDAEAAREVARLTSVVCATVAPSAIHATEMVLA